LDHYTEFIVRFDEYEGNGKYIAFLTPREKADRGVFLDDIKVDYLSDCEKTQFVSTRNTTSSSADVHWRTGKAQKWNIALITDTVDMGSIVKVDGSKILLLDTVTSMPYHITQCPDANRKYYVYVRTVCGDNNFGEWSIPAEFKTLCSPVSTAELGLIDFQDNGVLDCWIVGLRDGESRVSAIQNHALSFFNDTKSDGAYAIMPPLDVDSITRLQVSFDAHGGNSTSSIHRITVGVISNPTDISTFSSVETLSFDAVIDVSAKGNYGFNEAKRYTVRFNDYTGDYNGDYGKQIMFLSESGSAENRVFISNIQVDTTASCMEPVMLRIADVSATGATIQWENLGGDYHVQLLSDDDQQLLVDTIVRSLSSIRFNDLQILTQYGIRIRHICGEGDTSRWSNVAAFKTTCPMEYPLPYKEDFEDYPATDGVVPDCWLSYSNSTSPKLGAYVNSNCAKDGKMGLMMYRSMGNYSYAVLPNFEGKIQDLLLSFDYKNRPNSNLGYLEVGVATDVSSADGIDSTFFLIDSNQVPAFKDPNKVWHYYSRQMAAYTGNDGNIVLRAPRPDVTANNAQLAIDNVVVEKAADCLRPIKFSLISNSILSTSVGLTWQTVGKEKQWDILCLPAGSDITPDAAPWMTTDTTSVTLAGLTPATAYDFYVRARCSDEDMSDWSAKVTATTLVRMELADAHWNFDNADNHVANPLGGNNKQEKDWMFGNYKNQITWQGPNANYVPYNIKNTFYKVGAKTIQSHYALSNDFALVMGVSTKTYNGTYAVLPEINAAMDTLQVRFFGRAVYGIGSKTANADSAYNVANAKGTYQYAVKIGTVTDPYDISTFELLTDYRFREVTDAKTLDDNAHWEEVVVSLYGAQGRYIALLSDYDAPNIVYIDNVVVEHESACSRPTVTKVSDLTYQQGTFSWRSGKSKWNVKITTTDGTIVDQAVVTQPQWVGKNLQGQTDYVFSVQSACDGEEQQSAWAPLTFTTPCAPKLQDEYAYDFENNLYTYTGTLNIPECWTAGYLNGTDAAKAPQAIANVNGNYRYSRNGNRALQLYNTATVYGSYVILPATDFLLDTVALHFWARAAQCYPENAFSESSKNTLKNVNSSYQRSIVIGAVADIADLSTFVPLDTFTYSMVFTTSKNPETGKAYNVYNDPLGEKFWEEVVIPLHKYTGLGRIMILYPGNGNTGYFYIDDINIVPSSFCTMPSNLRVSNLTSVSADLLWARMGKDSVRLQLAYDAEFNRLVTDTVLTNTNGKYTARNLLSGCDYYYRLFHYCNSEETSDWTSSVMFTTDNALRFYEDFAAAIVCPAHWRRATVHPDSVFAGVYKVDDYLYSAADNHWRRSTTGLIADNDITAPTAATYESQCYYWLLSPTIDLTKVETDATLSLSFLLGISDVNHGTPNRTQLNDKLILAVSEDAGLT